MRINLLHLQAGRNWGGQELRIIEQSEWLLQHGHNVWVAAEADAALLREAAKRQIPHFALAFNRHSLPVSIPKVLQLLKRERLNLLDCHDKRSARLGWWLRQLSSARVIRSRHTIGPTRHTLSNRLFWRHGCDGVVVTAECIRQQLVELGLAKAERVYVASAGVDPLRFHPQLEAHELRAQLGIPTQHTVIANIGMIRPDKGQRDYVLACLALLEQYPNLTCLQIGDCTRETVEYKQAIQALAEQSPHGQRLRFVGYRPDVERYLALSDIVVVASTTTEGRTRLVSQSLLMRRNVVATQVGGLPEMLEHEVTGLLCPPEQPQLLAQTIERLLREPLLAQQLRNRAYQMAQRELTLEAMMQGMLRFYQKTLHHHPHTSP